MFVMFSPLLIQGKTICICTRMDYDRQRHSLNPSFTQLFIARSLRLCRYVEETIGSKECSTFCVFAEVLQHLEVVLPKLEGSDLLFLPSQRVTFARFKRDVYQDDRNGIDPLIVWTNIRTFIKGSIEATKSSGFCLSKEEYLKLGKKRCRLSLEQREDVYSIFVRYQKYTSELHLWDDCDRITSILRRLLYAKESYPDVFQMTKKSKIYVDEIQDYTQAECLLFFLLSGPGDLFLAGDPAQSVVEGTDFRFEEIRSVGYHVAGENHQLIPDKPKAVNVNFRSHSGILNTAAAILRCMFDAFPDSAKQLKEDQGLFRGPRPGVLHKVEVNRLATLVKEKLNGAVILVHDERKSYWKRLLDYPLIYGVCEAKGLEFKSVIALDFFASLPTGLQRPWRDLLLGRATDEFNSLYPEIEGHLKLLYTMVTRCIEQLFFAETESSVAGNAFVRWITTTSISRSNDSLRCNHQRHDEALATRNNVDSIETMTMARDEWLASGLDNAEMAESDDSGDILKLESLLERAIYCFEQGQDSVLASKARVHRSSLRFRAELESGTYSDDDDAEVKAASIIGNLLKEELWLECSQFCQSLLPFLSDYPRQRVQTDILSELCKKV